MIAANRLLAARCDYPLHLGVTEAGPAFQGAIKSAVAFGVLLAEGIGDTIRVSLSTDPVEQVKAGCHILSSLGLRPRTLEIVSCPGCGRLQVSIHKLAAQVEAAFDGFPHPLRIAVMGCVVNGPGESREADLGVSCGNGNGNGNGNGKGRERPLHIGALLGGAAPPLLRELSSYAMPLGEAFQLRDDLLGVFGDPQVTGKSHLEDLREGKHTLLIALALRNASPAHVSLLRRLLGNPHLTEAEAAQVRSILTVTGARTHIETVINQRREQALDLLTAPRAIHPDAHQALRQLADTATRRTS